MIIISSSINLSKIDKSKIVQGKTGAQYYNLDIKIFDQPDKYGNNVSITEKQTEEQRKNKEKPVYIGNGKIVFKSEAPTNQDPEWKSQATKEIHNSPSNDGLPF